MQEIAVHLAQKLKDLRAERGWSLTYTAEATGVSKAMLGQIERGESSPTVATLWKIATGFNVAFSSFISLPEQQIIPVSSNSAAVFTTAEMQVTPLFAFDPMLGFEMFRIELAAGAASYSSAHEQGVIEHLVVLEGELQLQLAGQWYSLGTGEGMRFQADQAHAYKNLGTQPTVIHDLIHYPNAHKKAEFTLE